MDDCEEAHLVYMCNTLKAIEEKHRDLSRLEKKHSKPYSPDTKCIFIDFSYKQISLKTEKNKADSQPEKSPKKLAPQNEKDVTHAIEFILHERMNKKQI